MSSEFVSRGGREGGCVRACVHGHSCLRSSPRGALVWSADQPSFRCWHGIFAGSRFSSHLGQKREGGRERGKGKALIEGRMLKASKYVYMEPLAEEAPCCNKKQQKQQQQQHDRSIRCGGGDDAVCSLLEDEKNCGD